jgi:hypothetical protein
MRDEMKIELTTQSVIAMIYEEPWPLTGCEKCGRLGAHVTQGWFDRQWCEDRVVHAVEEQAGTWEEVDVHPTALADKRLLLDLLLTNDW